jgi:hypothetical protein
MGEMGSTLHRRWGQLSTVDKHGIQMTKETTMKAKCVVWRVDPVV